MNMINICDSACENMKNINININIKCIFTQFISIWIHICKNIRTCLFENIILGININLFDEIEITINDFFDFLNQILINKQITIN